MVFNGTVLTTLAVHFMRNVLGTIPPSRSGHDRLGHPHHLAQPDLEHVELQFGEVYRMLTKSHPKVAIIPGLICSRPRTSR
jgi:hypothetical protein